MRYPVSVLALACGVWAWAQQPAAAQSLRPKWSLSVSKSRPTSSGSSHRRSGRPKWNPTSSSIAWSKARVQSQQEIVSLRREVYSLQQAIQTLQSRVRD